MARLHVLGDFQGPGERKTAETLTAELPEHWRVIAGRKLSGEERADMDLIVVGEHMIFVLEEKAWGPRIVLSDQFWKVRGEERRNPLDRVNHLARVLAGQLRTRVPGYLHASRGRHMVTAAVVLSHNAVELELASDYGDGDVVQRLSTITDWLQQQDSESDAALSPVREAVVSFLLGLRGRDNRLERIGPYAIIEELAPMGDVRCFHARDGKRTVLLRCYPMDGWGPDVDPKKVIEREQLALYQLDDLDRTWQVHPSFEHEARRWVVVPVVPARGKSLVASVKLNDPPRADGQLPQQVSVDVVRDAFECLHEVHEAGLLHRGLHPKRIFLGRGLRVKFSDFYLARVSGAQTIAPSLSTDADLGVPYRALECRDSIGFSTTASDVFSLALSLAAWLLGDVPAIPNADELRARVATIPVVGAVLADCLDPDSARRPTADAAATRLTEAAKTHAGHVLEVLDKDVEELAPGRLLADRYEILERLGRGGSAETWLARDTNIGDRRVIKWFHSQVVADAARQEYAVTDRIRHDRCARVYDAISTPAPGFLVLEYVEGDSLRSFFKAARPSAEECRTIALDVLSALGHLHHLGLLHRDVTPSNIVVTPTKRATLIDFGLSGGSAPKGIVGTPPFVAPEILARRPATAQSDLYGLSVTLIWLMLGRYPYAGDPIRGDDQRDQLIPPTDDERQTWGPLGAGLLDVLFQAAQADPARRATTAEELAAALQLIDDIPEMAGEELTNDTVDALRQLYRGSSGGNAGNRGLDDEFARTTYVPTLLDTALLPAILDGRLRLVLLTGNPGDGKTSFLVKVGETLRECGADVVADDPSGWRYAHDGHTYVAVYDASESHEGLSSDELMRRALDPARGEDPSRRTVMLAINDGRLLQFFMDNSDLYPDEYEEIRRQHNGDPPSDPSIALVDLKKRTLAPRPDGASLAGLVLDTFVAPARWQVCTGCVSRAVCPIFANATTLRGPGLAAVDELLTTSHLRRRRRATFRDVRSALAWLITGDRSCAQVHEARQRQMNLCRTPGTLVEDLAFAGDSADYLIQEWNDLDPATAVAPDVERAARADRAIVAHPAAFTIADRVRTQRRLFLGLWHADGLTRSSVRVYRYFEEFNRALAASPDELQDWHLPRLLLGLSRLLGAPGYRGSDLAITDQRAGGDWAVIKEISASRFSLSSPARTSAFIESRSDTLMLRHDSGPELRLTLDTAELVLRVADGELLGDSASEAVYQEIENFSSRLRRSPSHAVSLVDPAGRTARARVSHPRIVLEDV